MEVTEISFEGLLPHLFVVSVFQRVSSILKYKAKGRLIIGVESPTDESKGRL